MVALAEGRKYGPGEQRILLPRLSAGSGIYFFKCVINGQSTVLRFLNIPQVRLGDGAMAASSRPLEKSAVAADTLIFSKTGYTNGKMPVVGSGRKYDLRLFKTGGVERFAYIKIVNGMRKIGTCLLDGTDAKMIPTPDVNIEEAA
ncbi:MAG: hypothetical protein M3Y08_04435 [Fibrobacterota bacterium]|nr:hypothetical protein [Fibrobacterota bacterium]